jgi:hypothetical protein
VNLRDLIVLVEIMENVVIVKAIESITKKKRNVLARHN